LTNPPATLHFNKKLLP